MWKQPWGMAEGMIICMGLLLNGFILQMIIGNVDVDFYRYPSNLFFGLLFLGIIGILQVFRKKYKLIRWFSGMEAALPALITLLGLVIVMGLTRQFNHTADLSGYGWISRTGIMQMTVSWPFLFLFIYFLFVLGMVTGKRLARFRRKDMGFILNHAGLFIALTGAILGSGDLQRLQMTVQTGSTEWRAMTEQNEMIELPLAIELHDFTIEEYPPKLMLIHKETGTPLPTGQPRHLLIDDIPFQGKLLDWDVEVTNYLPMAAAFFQEDTVQFVEFQTVGATTALYIQAHNRINGESKSGWVSCGNHMFPYVSLPLSETENLIMPPLEPKRFISEVTAYSQNGEIREQTIEVNKPLKAGGWKIYQLSYDESKGKWSTISVFELVRDPWLPVVYTGIFMLLAGAVWLFLNAPKNKKL